MGLDMYLRRTNTHGYSLKQCSIVEDYFDWQEKLQDHKAKQCTFKQWSGHEESEVIPQALIDLAPEYKLHVGDYFKRIGEEVGYWRKANAIHNWFVQNVQNGEDDCATYIVTKEQLLKLREACQTVLNNAKLKDVVIHNGVKYTKEEGWTPIMESGRVVENPEVCAEELPTTGGFFFGSTDYDEYYIRDIQDTVNIVDTVLATTNFEVETISYHASW